MSKQQTMFVKIYAGFAIIIHICVTHASMINYSVTSFASWSRSTDNVVESMVNTLIGCKIRILLACQKIFCHSFCESRIFYIPTFHERYSLSLSSHLSAT